MKVQLAEVDGYCAFAELVPAADPKGYYMLKFTSRWNKAKDPDAEQVRSSMLLSPAALDELRNLLK
jgi:hypothetical protein